MTSAGGDRSLLLAAVRNLAHHIAAGTTRKLVERLLQLKPDAPPHERAAALAIRVPGDAAAPIAQLLAAWKDNSEVSPEALGWAIAGAEATDDWHRRQVRTDLVWTGPLGPGSAFRRTDQALLEVIERARKRLLVVSFAVYKVEAVQRALVAAIQRGVSVQLVLETGDASGGKYEGDPQAALDPALMTKAELIVWPLEQRPIAKSATGDPLWGVLHAKCALADNHLLFVSSANLTGAALALNIELGILVEGGDLPIQVRTHFSELIQRAFLCRVVGPSW
jgi:phosphatidylserine/phosphatidylglycerophosphate/cardiolipin synthase-like enzyme